MLGRLGTLGAVLLPLCWFDFLRFKPACPLLPQSTQSTPPTCSGEGCSTSSEVRPCCCCCAACNAVLHSVHCCWHAAAAVLGPVAALLMLMLPPLSLCQPLRFAHGGTSGPNRCCTTSSSRRAPCPTCPQPLCGCAAGAMSVFTTKSLLASLGVSNKRTGEAAAAINWVVKDGAGRLGRFLFARW